MSGLASFDGDQRWLLATLVQPHVHVPYLVRRRVRPGEERTWARNVIGDRFELNRLRARRQREELIAPHLWRLPSTWPWMIHHVIWGARRRDRVLGAHMEALTDWFGGDPETLGQQRLGEHLDLQAGSERFAETPGRHTWVHPGDIFAAFNVGRRAQPRHPQPRHRPAPQPAPDLDLMPFERRLVSVIDRARSLRLENLQAMEALGNWQPPAPLPPRPRRRPVAQPLLLRALEAGRTPVGTQFVRSELQSGAARERRRAQARELRPDEL